MMLFLLACLASVAQADSSMSNALVHTKNGYAQPYFWTAQAPATYALLSYGASTDIALPKGASFIMSTQGANGIIYTVTTSATDPGSLTSTAVGTYVCVSNCVVVEGPYDSGHYIHAAASGGSTCTMILRPVQ